MISKLSQRTPISERLGRATSLLLAATFLLAGLPVIGASPAGYEPQVDPTGDPTPLGAPSAPGTPTLPVHAPYDLVEYGVAEEDELGFHLYFKVVSFKGDPARNDVLSSFANYDIWARLDGTQTYYYLQWYAEMPGVGENPTGVHDAGDVTFCLRTEDAEDPFFFDCQQQRITATVDYDQNRFDAYVTKDALMGRAPISTGDTPTNAPLVTQGSRLSEMYVQASSAFPGYWYDRLPDVDYAPPYVFERGAANSRIRLSLDTGVPMENQTGNVGGEPTVESPTEETPANRVSVTPGVPTLIRLRLENLNAAKRIINLSAEAAEGPGADKWSLQVAPTLRIPGGESRVVNLIVNVSAKVQHREETVATVRGTSLGFADEVAALRLELVASAPPGPDHKVLYFHAAAPEYDTLSAALCQAAPCGGDRMWLNTLDEDSGATKDAGIRMAVSSIGGNGAGSFAPGYTKSFALDTPMASAVVLDTAQPVDVKLAFKTSAEFTAHVSLEISTSDTNRVVASGGASSSVKEGSVVSFTAMPVQDAARIEPKDGPLVARLWVRPPLTGTGAAAAAPTFMFVPGQSEFTMPFIADPNAANVRLSAGPAFIGLSAESSLEDFQNPGRGKLFNATVVNEGVEADDARLEILYDDPEWRVELFPGSRFHLAPGDGAKFALLVHAPEDAIEGDQLHVLVNATSLADPMVVSQLRFTAIVTKGLDIPDESHYYHEDAESSQKVVKQEGNNTPGFEGALLALAFLAVAWTGRRRLQK